MEKYKTDYVRALLAKGGIITKTEIPFRPPRCEIQVPGGEWSKMNQLVLQRLIDEGDIELVSNKKDVYKYKLKQK